MVLFPDFAFGALTGILGPINGEMHMNLMPVDVDIGSLSFASDLVSVSHLLIYDHDVWYVGVIYVRSGFKDFAGTFIKPEIVSSIMASSMQVCSEIIIRLGSTILPIKSIRRATFKDQGVDLLVESCEKNVFIRYDSIKTDGDFHLPGEKYTLPSKIFIRKPDNTQVVTTWHAIGVFNLLKTFF